jgi:hypothetical protein
MELIVSIIVGGIPVVLEAYDRYSTVSQAFSCFRNHGSELDKLDAILSTQKTLFRGSVVEILTTLTQNPTKARSLLATGAALEGFNAASMVDMIEVDSVKEAFESWERNLSQIRRILESICDEIDSFQSKYPTNPGTVRTTAVYL